MGKSLNGADSEVEPATKFELLTNAYRDVADVPYSVD